MGFAKASRGQEDVGSGEVRGGEASSGCGGAGEDPERGLRFKAEAQGLLLGRKGATEGTDGVGRGQVCCKCPFGARAGGGQG